MAVKKVKPTSPGRRFQVYSTFDEITSSTPEKGLLRPIKKTGGRNANGRITCRHRGGGQKRHYRIIDFKRDKTGIPAKVASIEYDPNRSARIALLHYADGEKRYILAPVNLKVNDKVESGPDADIKPGNTLPLSNIPLGTHIHNIELSAGKGGQIVRSAGTFAQLMAKESYEFGHHQGLGWIDASVIRIEPKDKNLRVPHVGWDDLIQVKDNALFKGIKKDR